jgi:hypothetical protein
MYGGAQAGLPARGGEGVGGRRAGVRAPLRVFVSGTQGAAAPKLHGGHLAVALPFAIFCLKIMGEMRPSTFVATGEGLARI